jgi:hypothetical protein
MRLNNDPSRLQKLLEMIDSTVILHNILIWHNNTVDISTWLDKLNDDEFSDMDATERVPEGVPLRHSVPLGARKCTRREQSKAYVRKTFIHAHNYATGSKESDSSDDCLHRSFGF